MNEIVGTGAHLSREQLRVWTSLNDAIRIVDSEIEADLLANHHMTHREYEVLVRVDGAGGRARMSALAMQIEASAPLITAARLWLCTVTGTRPMLTPTRKLLSSHTK